MNWYLFLLGSSVGKKILMALTGLCLIGFLAVHLLGNVMAFAGAEAFNGYAAKLHSLQPYLSVFNLGLAMLGLVHVVIGTLLFFENLKARPTKYMVYKNPGGRTIGSNTMPYTGVLILIFVISHLLKFTFVDKSVTPIYQQMAAAFANPVWVFLYVVAIVMVAVHISHGFWSMFQTFGMNNPRYFPLIMKLGLLVTLVFGIGFGILPIYLLIIA
ncbi:MAG: succinate dehydrogenase cytochrome b subunit [Desulfobacteraceae bacterium]|jgi:succinate dehydrogenase / fumarate reductase cytochrome b subunit|nr:succinate dehydrogenase cytochrome b subunit [Desulfobacteraceae bacterium]